MSFSDLFRHTDQPMKVRAVNGRMVISKIHQLVEAWNGEPGPLSDFGSS